LSLTGKGHATDRAVALGLQGYIPKEIADTDVDLDSIVQRIWHSQSIQIDEQHNVHFSPSEDIILIKARHCQNIPMA